MPHVLVLNASYEPLGVVPLRRALVLVLENKAVCLEESGAFMHSATACRRAQRGAAQAIRTGSPTGARFL
ncbi:hypothetical protein SALBM311S_01840 [Streptomyces alboniger]